MSCDVRSHVRNLMLVVLCLVIRPLSAAESPAEFVDVKGKRHAPFAAVEKKGSVLVFVSPYCPTSGAFVPEVNRLVESHGNLFAFYFVEADAGISLPDAEKHAEMLAFKAPLLLDPKQEIIRRTQVKVTPEVVVVNGKGETLYQGRINDLYLTRTKKQPEPKMHDLRDALAAIAEGKAVATPRTQAIGCSITLEK